ncbi:MAG: tetratricopeptide repeat protein [Hyphomicrobium sp.]
MRTSKLVLASSLALVLAAASAAAGGVAFRSSEDALKQGISAFNGGYYELALPALEAANGANTALGKFYLARIYADNDGPYTDHLKAYELYKQLADQLRDVDPDDSELAPIAAMSLTAMSDYVRRGLPEAGLKANAEAADSELQRAALFFNNEDAQFEMAKVFLRGEGPDINLGGQDDPSSKVVSGRHWLSRLSRKGHPGAQAFLADLLWRGKFVPKDPANALNLIDVAVANAPAHERVWIEDIYQNIYCNAGEGVREQATGRVAEWRNSYGRHQEQQAAKDGLDDLNAVPVRTCANGELVKPMGPDGQPVADPAIPQAAPPAAAFAPPAPPGIDAGFAPRN